MPEVQGKPQLTLWQIVRKVGKWVLIFDALGVVVLTLIQGFLGQGLITNFMSDGAAQTMTGFGWWAASFGNAICFMIAVDFILFIIAAILAVIFIVLPSMGRRRTTTPTTTDKSSTDQPTE